eukprot:3377880-Amphidinium_carterae.1
MRFVQQLLCLPHVIAASPSFGTTATTNWYCPAMQEMARGHSKRCKCSYGSTASAAWLNGYI